MSALPDEPSLTINLNQEGDTVEMPKTPSLPIDISIDPTPIKKKKVSSAATIMNLLNSLLGAGILGIPNTFALSGIVLGLMVMLLVVFMSDVSCQILIKLAHETRSENIGEIAEKILGKTSGKFLSLLIAVFCVSCMTAYLVIAADIVESLIGTIGFKFDSVLSRAALVLIVSLSVPVPLTIPKDITALTSISAITVMFIAIYGVSMLAEAIIIIPSRGVSSTVSYFKLNSQIFSVFSVHSMTYALPIVLLPLLSSYSKNPTKRQVLSSEALGICFILVVVPSILGYLMFGADSSEMILNSFPDTDIIMGVVRLLFFFIVAFSYPVVAHCAMSSFSQILCGKEPPHDAEDATDNGQPAQVKQRSTLLLIMINLIPILVACFLPNVRPALSIGGAIGGCLVDFFYPGLLWVVHSTKKLTHWTNIACILFATFGGIMAIISTIRAITDAVNG